jgi:hypothetical protein
MMNFTTRKLATLVSMTSLLAAMACSGSDPSSGSTYDPLSAGKAKDKGAEADDDGPGDKITCAVDADCDSDETCVSGRCTGLDGEDEDDDDGAADAADDGDEDEDDADDAEAGEADDGDEEDEGAADKITCAVDADCDADEVCTAGMCTGIDGEDEDDDEEEEGADDNVACSADTDCDADEVCTNGTCT